MKPKNTLEKFLKRARGVHGDRFNYDKAVYVDAHTKLIITCPVHGDFFQSPNGHLNRNGCDQCGHMNRRSNKDSFIERAKIKHNHKYNYDKVDYKLNNIKVTIGCPIHGDFDQKPNDHLNGAGCPSCKESKGEKRIAQILLNYEIPFVRQFKFANAGRYEYDFYLPMHQILIEFHGRQHFEAIGFFGGPKRLEYTQRCDKIKRRLAKHVKIPLIEFTHHDLKLPEDEFERLVLQTIKRTVEDRRF